MRPPPCPPLCESPATGGRPLADLLPRRSRTVAEPGAGNPGRGAGQPLAGNDPGRPRRADAVPHLAPRLEAGPGAGGCRRWDADRHLSNGATARGGCLGGLGGRGRGRPPLRPAARAAVRGPLAGHRPPPGGCHAGSPACPGAVGPSVVPVHRRPAGAAGGALAAGHGRPLAHARLGAIDPSLFVVRPNNRVGFRCGNPDPARALAYFQAWRTMPSSGRWTDSPPPR